MKTTIYTTLIILFLYGTGLTAQEKIASEKFGKTLNLGLGLGYYGYVGHAMPVVHANFELDIARNLTIAPFITVYTYRQNYYWGDQNNKYRNYYYRETVIPIGGKVSYYFDQLFKAGSKWDFYLAGSLGFAIRTTTWESGYYGETTIRQRSSPLYIDAHIGSEYHMNEKTGLFLDLSSGVSTFGLAIHF